MKKSVYLILLLTCCSFKLVSQSNATGQAYIIAKLKKNFLKGSVYEESVEIYFSKSEGILDFDNYQFKLKEVTVRYEYYDRNPNLSTNWLEFHCDYGNCITDPNGKVVSGFSLPFKSKKAVYEFIEILGELRKKLKD
jgi:hypothetical protein